MSQAQSRRSRAWQVPFFTIWSLQAASLLGSFLVGFALVWWLTESTGSATVLATATLVEMLPRIGVAPFAGALVDRWNRRSVMMAADGIIALATAAVGLLFSLGIVQVWHIYLLMFVRSTAGGFHWVAMQASTSLMVPEEQLSRIGGMNQTLMGAANILTPLLGALLLGLLPIEGVLAIDVFTAFLAISPLLFVAIPQPMQRPTETTSVRGLLRDMGEGLKYVWGWHELTVVLGIAMLSNLFFNPAFSLLPILVTNHFGGGALQLGWMNSVFGFGMVAGGLILSVWGGFRRPMATTSVGLIGMTAGVILTGLAPAQAFYLGLAGMLVAGLMNPICNGPFNAILQANVPAHMQGRVLSLVSSLSGIVSPLGMAVAGPVADWLGVQAWYLATSITIVAWGVAILRFPSVMDMNAPPKSDEEEKNVELEQPSTVTANQA